jgi:peptidoglycan/xylan/chitin deacetylase (PgdA/CDA1 family)
MDKIDRRQALLTVAAGAVGLLAGGGPILVRSVQSDPARPLKARRTAVHGPPPDPGYAHGPIHALRRPVHGLGDLSPAAPPTAVALTIDDGPHPTWTPRMLDLLAEFRVHATFSLIGEQVVEYPQLVKRIVADGHQISDHTMTHPMNLPDLSASAIRTEIGQAHDRIAQATGVAPKFFRAPGGAWSNQILDTATEHGMLSIDWAVDPPRLGPPRHRTDHRHPARREGRRHPPLPRRRRRPLRDDQRTAEGHPGAEAARPDLRHPLAR